MRTERTPEDLPGRAFYQLLTAVVVPRPIAWVSTTSAAGVDNLAPHSFFTVACSEPPIVQFTSVGRKDSLRNVEETGEFVVNLAPEPLQEAVNATGTPYPPAVSEFDRVGVEREPSAVVKPPRVAASPVALECRVHSTLRLGDSTVVFGRVVHVALDEDVLVDGHPEVTRLRPLARLGRNEWSTLGEVRAVDRIPYDPPRHG
jgi:flavin reductase (DIM6/NTAB) family NADH-FMN oxidoreductase RutF